MCLIFLVAGISLHAQEIRTSIDVGDVLVLQKPKGGEFVHVQFPRKNMIIKQGGIANMKPLYGQKVLVTRVDQIPYGNTEVVLRPVNGRRFFGYLSSVKAHLDLALAAGELMPVQPKQKEALVNR